MTESDELLKKELIVDDHHLQLPEEVASTINEILQSDDEFDSDTFDLISHVNRLFPTQQSLSNIDERIEQIENNIEHLNDEIRESIRVQNDISQQGEKSLELARRSVDTLADHVEEISKKAKTSGDVVRDLTKGIKQLDLAKQNITQSITILNQLHILVDGAENLRVLCREKKYDEAAPLIQGVVQVMKEFQTFRQTISSIDELCLTVENIRTDLSEQIIEEFERLTLMHMSKNNISNTQGSERFQLLKNAARIADCLDDNVKLRIITTFIKHRLEEYSILFADNQECAWLDSMEKRYSWMKKNLNDFDESCISQIFPPHWDMSECVAVQFCNETREQFERLLKERATEISIDSLVSCVKKTNHFEQLLNSRFNGTSILFQNYCTTVNRSIDDIGENSFNQIISSVFHSFSYIFIEFQQNKLKILLDKQLKELNELELIKKDEQQQQQQQQQTQQMQQNVEDESNYGFNIGSSSSSSTDLKDHKLNGTIITDQEDKRKKKKADDNIDIIMDYSVELFLQFKDCILEAMVFDSEKLLIDLSSIFRFFLEDFSCRILLASLPGCKSNWNEAMSSTDLTRINNSFRMDMTTLKPEKMKESAYQAMDFASTFFQNIISNTAAATESLFVSAKERQKLLKDDIQQICRVICTADYCIETTQQLELKMKSKINERLHSEISFAKEDDAFIFVIQQAHLILVDELITMCEMNLLKMSQMLWSGRSGNGNNQMKMPNQTNNNEMVLDQSAYVISIEKCVSEFIPLVRESLSASRKFFTQFCIRFIDSFLSKYLFHLYNCRQVSTEGAEQLLLDSQSIRSLLVSLPTIKSPWQRKPPISYLNVLNKKMSKVEIIIKCVMWPTDNVTVFIDNYIRLVQLGTTSIAANLNKTSKHKQMTTFADEDTFNVTNFQKVIDMKSVKKNQASQMMDEFCKKAKQHLKATIPNIQNL
ncbi:hypothetical protein SNEBB_009319 [Seison nebaliae]|nr:hypothetical protein SNEBB_009319 [Seison nebaliae]